MATIVDTLLYNCSDSTFSYYYHLATWSDITEKDADILLTVGKKENYCKKTFSDFKEIKVVDDIYRKELQAFFEDPSIIGCRKFEIFNIGDMSETITITKDLDNDIHVAYHLYEFSVDDEIGLCGVSESHAESSLKDANPEDFGDFEYLIKIMIQYYFNK